MAMEATHVRFARDLAGRLDARDLDAYYSGAVYPDSRYATGIPRAATHQDDRCPNDPFARGLSDFEKGWATHIAYDQKASVVRQETLAMIPDECRADNWAFATAVKLVEDLESVRLLGDDMSILRRIKLVLRPYGEDPEIMERYYADLREAYATPCESVFQYLPFSLKLGIAPERAARMAGLADRLASDPAIRSAILSIYSKVAI